jgi:RHS repeat-associated protein
MRYPIADEHSSISLELDDTGQMISYEEYSGFGGTTHRTLRKNIPKPFRFATKRRDQETSLYYFGGRYYAPWLCRWMNPDPSGLVDGTNTYIYCGADPINHFDPDGNMMRSLANAALRQNPQRNRSTATPEPGEDAMGGAQRDLVPPPREERNSPDRQRGGNVFGNNRFARFNTALDTFSRSPVLPRTARYLAGTTAQTIRGIEAVQGERNDRAAADAITTGDLFLTTGDTLVGVALATTATLGATALLPAGATLMTVAGVTIAAGSAGAVLQNLLASARNEHYGDSPASRVVDPVAQMLQTAQGYRGFHSATVGAYRAGRVLNDAQIVSTGAGVGVDHLANVIQSPHETPQRAQEGSDQRRERASGR